VSRETRVLTRRRCPFSIGGRRFVTEGVCRVGRGTGCDGEKKKAQSSSHQTNSGKVLRQAFFKLWGGDLSGEFPQGEEGYNEKRGSIERMERKPLIRVSDPAKKFGPKRGTVPCPRASNDKILEYNGEKGKGPTETKETRGGVLGKRTQGENTIHYDDLQPGRGGGKKCC